MSGHVELHAPRLAGANRTRMSRHAEQRCAQRSIPQIVVEGLLDFGEELPVPGGAYRYVFGKKGWARFQRHLGREGRHFERYRRAYIVVSNDAVVITSAWQD